MKDNIKETIEVFLKSWDRQAWMADHGEWASAQWEEEREDYRACTEALEATLEDALKALRSRDASDLRDGVPDIDLKDIEDAYEELGRAANALLYQVRPDESDYIAEGTIDPDGVADDAEHLGVEVQWQGWDCTEGWSAYRVGEALYAQWYRNAYGNRHDRELWVCVDGSYFREEESQ